jgi:hypothetical protein
MDHDTGPRNDWKIDLSAKPVVVIDTNALFQAMLNDMRLLREKWVNGNWYDRDESEFAGSRLFTAATSGWINLATSPHIRNEVDRLLERHRGSRNDPARTDYFNALRELLA